MRALPAVLLSVGLLLPLWWQLCCWHHARLLGDERSQVAIALAPYDAALTTTLNRHLDRLQGLRALVQTDPSPVHLDAHFETFAAGLCVGAPGIRNLVIAPGGVNLYVYPLAGNEVVPGLDLVHDERPAVHADVRRAMQTGRVTLSGPYELRQGGLGLVARQAVDKDGDFWGLVAMALDLPPILAEAGLDPPPPGLAVALRDGTGQVFYGIPSLYDDDPVVVPVDLPEGAWELAGLPAAGWAAAIQSAQRMFQATSLVIAGLLAGLVYLETQQRLRLQLAIRERTRELENELLERGRAEKEIRSRSQELATINALLSDITGRLDLHECLDRALRGVLALTGAEGGLFYLVQNDEQQRETLTVAAAVGVTDALPATVGRSLRLDECPGGQVLQAGEPLILWDDASPDEHTQQEAVRAGGLRFHASFPLLAHDRVTGLVSILDRGAARPTERSLAMVHCLCGPIALAIENSRLFEQARASAARLRELAHYLQGIQEKERARVARELHDELGQALTVLKIDLSRLCGRLSPQDAALEQQAHDMATLIDQTLETVRRLATELRPGLLDRLGLAAAIEWQAEEITRRTGLQVELDLQGGDRDLDRDLATAVFRVVQEALTNVVRHAQATRVRVTLCEKSDEVRLRVQDDGRGITPGQSTGSQSLGLTGIRERAQALGGQVGIEGVPNQGTTLTLRIPRLVAAEEGDR